MRKHLFTLLLCFFGTAAFPQSNTVLHFELGGPGLASFNVDTRFTKKNGGLGGRIGFGGVVIDGDGHLYVPIGLNYLIGKDNKNFFEIGGGATIVSNSDGYYNNGIFNSTFGHLWFGYRWQPPAGGFSFRGGFCPVFNKNNFIPYFVGFSLGYKL